LGCNLLRSSNVGSLSALIAAAKQERDLIAAPSEINSVSGSEVHPHFANAFAHRFHVAGIAQAEAIYSHKDPGSGFMVTQPSKPRIEYIRLEYFDHL